MYLGHGYKYSEADTFPKFPYIILTEPAEGTEAPEPNPIDEVYEETFENEGQQGIQPGIDS
jgi:hypothetical protein